MARWRCAFWAGAVLAGCAGPMTGGGRPATHDSLQTGPSTRSAALMPRKLLFGNPERTSPRLSPDGTRIAYLAPVKGVLNIWVGPLDKVAAASPVTHETARGIRGYVWAYTNQHLLYVNDTGGDENWHVFCVDLSTHSVRDLTPVKGAQAQIRHLSDRTPQEIVIGLNDRDPKNHDLYRLNILTGQRKRILENNGMLNYVLDDDYNVRMAIKPAADGGHELLRADDDNQWKTFAKVPLEDSETTEPIGFDAAGTTLYMYDSRGRNTAALTAVHWETGDETALASDPNADVSAVLRHAKDRRVLAAAATYERRKWKALDSNYAADIAALEKAADGDFEVVSQSLDGRTWLVAFEVDDGPLRYYTYDRDTRQTRLLFTNRPSLEQAPLCKMRPVRIRARDSLTLVGYVTLPRGCDSGGDWRPETPQPMVLLVHGGPWARDEWGYDAHHQWLANRGYAVLSVNFRGSTGLGKRHLNAGNKQWGAKMHDDLIDAVNWAVTQGIADPARVAIMGGSYGGYATLAGLTMTPDVFACGVDLFGPSNLATLLESIPPYWAPMVNMFAARVGDHRTADGRALLEKRSPLTLVDRIKRPLLIGQGANDPRVKQSESDQIVQAMQAKGLPVMYVLFSDEGHGFARPENSLAFHAVAEAFLARHLGGRCEPVGGDFAGSTIAVKAGEDQAPGVADGLRRAR